MEVCLQFRLWRKQRNNGDIVLLLDVFDTWGCDLVTDLSSCTSLFKIAFSFILKRKHVNASYLRVQVSLDLSPKLGKSLTFTILLPHCYEEATAPSCLPEELINYYLCTGKVWNLSASCTDFYKASLFFCNRLIPIKWLFNREFVSVSMLLPFYLFKLTYLAENN